MALIRPAAHAVPAPTGGATSAAPPAPPHDGRAPPGRHASLMAPQPLSVA